jgi:hypothetical protein
LQITASLRVDLPADLVGSLRCAVDLPAVCASDQVSTAGNVCAAAALRAVDLPTPARTVR